jgi:hypothetical protein
MNENNSDKKIWTWHYGDDDPYNLLGTIRTLDGLNVVSLDCSQTRYPAESDLHEPGLIAGSTAPGHRPYIAKSPTRNEKLTVPWPSISFGVRKVLEDSESVVPP